MAERVREQEEVITTLKRQQYDAHKEKENSLCKILKDENDSLIAQRNVLAKTKESLIKDLEKKGRELERFQEDYKNTLDRLQQANDRLIKQYKDLELEKDALFKKHEALEEEKNEEIARLQEELETTRKQRTIGAMLGNMYNKVRGSEH